MWVNNEVGVGAAGRGDRRPAVATPACRFHTDAVQAFGKVPVACSDLPCTLLTLSGHKIGAPKGIGALVVRDRKAVEAIIHGGGQQYGIRPGTENVAGAVALGRAAALAAAEQAGARRPGSRRCATQLAARLLRDVPDLVVNGASGDARAARPQRLHRRAPTARRC